ncbi:MAG: TIGR02206 family membrane protein [Chthoniobacteraceae bacterium]
MFWLQVSSLALAILGPVALWAAHRRRPHPHVERTFARSLAFLLLAVFGAGLVQKHLDGEFDAAHALPMQLCDWTLLAVVAALLGRWQTCFELGYFWGLCGTLQALFTPAIGSDLDVWRQAVFFLDHAGIVAGVLFLLLVPRLRPRSMGRVLLCSELYLASALAVNALTGANYGFLAHPPEQASLLDLFSKTRWRYVLEINLVALLFFAAAYAPWWIADRRRRGPGAGPIN